MLYDVVLQAKTPSGNGKSLPHTNMGSVWSPEVYGGKERMHELGNLWWSLPCNKYDCWECCVEGMTMLPNETACLTDPESRAALRGILPMLDAQDSGRPGFSKAGHWDYSSPGGWNHLDQLAVCLPATWQGPGLSVVEQHAHFSLWAVLASPLLLAFDARKHPAGSPCIEMVTNKRVMAISQDALGVGGRRLKDLKVSADGKIEAQLWGRPLAGGSAAVLLLNRGSATANLSATFAEAKVEGGASAGRVVDAWSGSSMVVTDGRISAVVPSHGAALLVVTPQPASLRAKTDDAAQRGSPRQCYGADKRLHPCGPSAQRCGPAFPASERPVYHLKDLSCGESDPNGPFYDRRHGMYHLFYQASIGEANAAVPNGGGPIWGHYASSDFVRWTHLDLPMWNDRWYDSVALFSGSATMVDGVPHLVYPGLCDTAHPGCRSSGPGQHHMGYAAAVPSNRSDPFLTHWEKPPSNPLINGSAGDPSAAWRTKHGEWRFIGTATHEPTTPGVIQNASATIWAAPRFEGPWSLVGLQPGFHAGEMPTLFPLPPLYPGTRAEGGALPTHVRKRGPGSRADPARNMWQLGNYVDGAPGVVGKWTALTNESEMDQGVCGPLCGYFKSAKDFYDEVKGRRIFWGWAASAKALPRSVTYHPQLKQLVWSPVEELVQLHTGVRPLAHTILTVTPGAPHTVLPDVIPSAEAGASGAIADVNVSFRVPRSAATLAVEVLGGALVAFVNFVPPPPRTRVYGVTVGVGPGSRLPTPSSGDNATANVTRMMRDTDLGGADFSITHHPASYNATGCQALCDSQAKCKAWVWAVRGHPAGSGDCCLKEAVPCPVHKPPVPGETVTSGAKAAGVQRCCECSREHCDCPHGMRGVRRRRPPPPITLSTDTLQLLPSDESIDIRVFTDRGLVEVYFMDGRSVFTTVVPQPAASGAVSLVAEGSAATATATVWAMGSVWARGLSGQGAE